MSASLARTLFRPAPRLAPAATKGCPAARFFPSSPSGANASIKTGASARTLNAIAHISVAAALVASSTDTLESFIQPAKLQVLVVPVHPIKRATFEQYVQLVKQYAAVPLADVPPDRRGDRAVFSANPSSSGSLLFDFVTPATYAPLRPLSFLAELQTHRRVQGIIGIFDASEYSQRPLEEALASFQASLKNLPKTFATKVYGFGANEAQVEQARGLKESDGLVTVPSQGDVGFYLKTFLAEFASGILWEFSNMAAQLESRTSIPTPQEPDSVSLQRAVSRASVDSYTVPDRASTPDSRTPINGVPLLGVAAPPQSHPHTVPTGVSAAPKRESSPYGSSPLLPPIKPILPTASATSGVSSSAQLVDARARKRVAGREKKLMGDMWLLSGRPQEAIAAYNEAILLTKAWSDQVWQASAYEGVAVALVLQATQPRGSQGTHPPSLTPQRSESPASLGPAPDISTFLSAIPERLTLATTLYEKMLAPLNSSRDSAGALDPDRAHPLLYVEACLRSAKFLLAVNEARGSIPKALKSLVSPTSPVPIAESGPEQASRARLNSLAPSNTVPRSSIAAWLDSAYSPHLATLSVVTRTRILADIASCFGRIGYRRKEAFVLREVAALCADSAASHQASLALQDPSGNGSLDLRIDTGSKSSRNGTNGKVLPTPRRRPGIATDTQLQILEVLERVCSAYGLDPGPTGDNHGTEENASPIEPTQTSSAENRFGWPSIQLGVLQDATRMAEIVNDYQNAIRFTILALRTLATVISPEDQIALCREIPRIVAAATRSGMPLILDYWGPPQIVMSLEIAKLAKSRQPHKQRMPDAAAGIEGSGTKPTTTNPFLYDPRMQSSPSRDEAAVLVQDDIAEVFVTLQNPFLFELEIAALSLSTRGARFASETISVVVPPASLQTVRMVGTPLEPGTLQIRGCSVQLAGCKSREFLLPTSKSTSTEPDKTPVKVNSRPERIKHTGLDALASRTRTAAATSKESGGEAENRFLECTVVPAQPLLWMRSTSLTHGALMLFDGETSTIRITLENASTVPVDYVHITCADSLTTATRQYLSDAELEAAEIYELEVDAVERPVFRWLGSQGFSIAPGSSRVLEVECRGKIGCMSGSILVDYGFRGNATRPADETLWTRRLCCDVLLTVHQTLVAHSLELSHLRSTARAGSAHARSASVVSLGQRGAAVDSRLEDNLRDVADGEHCLAQIAVTNVSSKPFEVKLERKEEENSFYLERKRAEPGSTHVMLVRLDRLCLSPEQVERPIPSLSEKQFIAAKVKRSAEEERLERELFWYRQELLQRIRLVWNEVGSLRTGEIGLQALKLEPSALDILRQDQVQIQLRLSGESVIVGHRHGRSPPAHTAAADDFLAVEARITTKSGTSSLHWLSVLVPPGSPPTPLALAHLARYVVIEGVSPIDVGMVDSEKEATVSIPICLLAQGRYEFGCVVEELSLSSNVKPRTWRARSTLVIKVDR
ncbi:hypothetical protein RHOSPDRAFT_34430 [Rhodotorula sp. JG-1b]|nr:hypothetical protein RHOSPDRAFT_34430 [Rhodotorula sp. JG-1b]